ncbi:hypothetical protein vBAcePPAc_0090 [Aeromonas phage vB_AceP_PAc]|nr:hypothetical protein vBAcePPAc_0090 [Aeromonas phage vB_AceP_PAc]
MNNKQKELDVLECLGYTNISEVLSGLPDEYSWDIWKDFDFYRNTVNFGIFIYDENMYYLTDFACHGGVLTGSKHYFNKLKEVCDVKFHGWYQDNIFIILGCIPYKLWLQSGVEKYLKSEHYVNDNKENNN